MNFMNINAYANYKFPERKDVYEPEFTEFVVPRMVRNWYEENFGERKPNRPTSLLLVGPTRRGKTEWARSLGKHIYWNGYYDLNIWEDEAEYVVLDDMPYSRIPIPKSFLGCQKNFTMTDKYRKKIQVKGSKPVIWLVNNDMNPFRDGGEFEGQDDLKSWMNDNLWYYKMGEGETFIPEAVNGNKRKLDEEDLSDEHTDDSLNTRRIKRNRRDRLNFKG